MPDDFARLRATIVATALCLSLPGCGTRTPYPAGVVIDFSIQCARNMWSGSPTTPLDLREAFCRCIVERSQVRYDIEAFDRIWQALQRSGFRSNAAGIPPGFVAILGDCRAELERGALHVE
jgi:hypothetical protein